MAAAPQRLQLVDPPAAALARGAQTLTVLVPGRVATVELDGRRVQTLSSPCAPFVARFTVRLTRPGAHVVRVRAGGASATWRATVASSAGTRPRSRIEAAAAAAPLRCLTRSTLTLAPGRSLRAGERLVLDRGGKVSAVSATSLGLTKTGAGTYRFRTIRGAFRLRLGDDWGGLDAQGRRAVAAPALDRARAAGATIGPKGGRIQVTDATGVVTTFEVPPGALTAATRITVTPLAGPALPGASQPGLRFAPAGLTFARPALIRLDYSKTRHRVLAAERVQLLSSAMTALPLPGRAVPARGLVLGRLSHFSTTLGGLSDARFADLAAWADAVLRDAGRTTLSELEQLAAIQAACTGECPVTREALRDAAAGILRTLTTEACALDVADPSDAALERWMGLQLIAQAAGVDAGAAGACATAVLRSLIVDAGDDTVRLAELLANAQLIGASDAEALALAKLADALRSDLFDARARCPRDVTGARAALDDIAAQADLLGESAIAADARAASAACTASPPGPGPGSPPPPVTSAAGCDADIATPKQAALEFWRLKETAAPAGADVSAVRDCIASLFTALSGKLASDAGASPDDAALQAFVALSDHAVGWGYPASSVTVLQALAGKLRGVLVAAKALCGADPAGAQAGFTRVAGWAQSVSRVDPALAADAATSTCDAAGGALTVQVAGGAARAVCCGSPNSAPVASQQALTLGALPASAAAAVSGADSSVAVTQPEPARVAMAFTGSTSANLTFSYGTVLLDVTPSVSGTLYFTWNSAWAGDPLPAGTGVAVGTIAAQTFEVKAQAEAGLPIAAANWSTPVAAGETVRYVLNAVLRDGATATGHAVQMTLGT